MSLANQAEINFIKRLKAESLLINQSKMTRRNKEAALVSQWQDDAIRVAWKSDMKRSKETMRYELVAANIELMNRRRQELKQLLDQDAEKYRQELASMGLTAHMDRI
ncbi:hypothetical protein BDK51DRAFT_28683 [Blyttiomyces helicus]|uniref:Uncharacterized protein n=1 Tax=Blyttiomyces helicus TaxID=388810 RepID=A0A4P9WNB9_9FUNG|nr:hypothetical protein BDK51DRAFT_28683 [Blyttiomyces helicus]|eukprot:RKO92256.1 hypothetical protein BDK51DRAFT_28683 [Blyttiomyces helicus]